MRIQSHLFFFLFGYLLCAQNSIEVVDFLRVSAKITPVFETKQILGKSTYKFKLKRNTDSIFLDAVNMDFSLVSLNGGSIEYSNSKMKLGFRAPNEIGEHELFLNYVAKPKQAVYFITEPLELKTPETLSGPLGTGSKVEFKTEDMVMQVWTQGQGKYTSHWLPSFDDMTEKVELDLSITADSGHKVIANGQIIAIDSVSEYSNEWKFDMQKPMSSYLAAFVVGDFEKKVIQSSSGVTIELYYEPQDSLKVEPTYRYTKKIFDFLEQEIGVAYPWQNYKQVPVHDFLYAGMENTSCTIFSNQYMIDSIASVDKNYINVNAHELAHQWFGNLVTEQSGKHHWLHEGFATYYAYLAEQQLFGDAHFYWKLYNTAKTLHNLSENGDGEALTNPNANSLTFYEKGAWALVMLKEKIGESAFKTGTKNYLEKHQFQNVTIADFLRELGLVANKDLSAYREKWLESEEFPWKEVSTFLKSKEPSLKQFFEIKETVNDSAAIKVEGLMRLLEKDMPKAYKRQVILDYGNQIPDSSLSKILRHGNIEVRQAIALMITEVSKEFKIDFESLLHDDSYLTKEVVLYKLWEAFPEDRARYLNETKDIVGLPNMNVRLLWLTLALVTPDYEPSKKQAFYRELNGYTAPNHHFEVRQSAFQYLYQIQALSDEAIKNLVDALDHHVWQFKKSSRNLVRKLVENTTTKNRILQLKETLGQQDSEALLKILNE